MIPAVTEMIAGISGMELRGIEKLGNNLVRGFYLFILHLFLRCVIYLLPHFILQ